MKKICIAAMLLLSFILLTAITADQMDLANKLNQSIQTVRLSHFNERVNKPSEGIVEEYEEGQWVQSGKIKFFYNTSNLMTSAVFYQQIMPDSFIAIMKYAYEYNTNGNPSEFSLNMNINYFGEPVWVPFMVMDYAYNNQNHLIHSYGYTNEDNAGLVANHRSHVFYNNNVLSEMHEWDFDSESNLTEFHKMVFVLQNGRIQTINNHTSSDSTDWTVSARNTWEYDPTDTSNYENLQHLLDHGLMGLSIIGGQFSGMRIISQLTENRVGETWVNEHRELYTYSPQWDLISDLDQYYYTDQWYNGEKMEYTYDENHNVLTQTEIDWEDNAWVPDSRYTYIYGTGSSDITISPSKLKINTYPNPFFCNASLQIKSESSESISLALYDVKGRKISATVIPANSSRSTYDLNNLFSETSKLSSGIYFIKATQGSTSNCQKIIRIK